MVNFYKAKKFLIKKLLDQMIFKILSQKFLIRKLPDSMILVEEKK